MADDFDPDEIIGLHEWDLVLPFLCVESRDGPFDDRAFTAGVQLGAIYACLRLGVPEVDQAAYPEIAATVDLIAMRYGYRIDVTPLSARQVDEGEGEVDWVRLRLRRPRRG